MLNLEQENSSKSRQCLHDLDTVLGDKQLEREKSTAVYREQRTAGLLYGREKQEMVSKGKLEGREIN